MGWSTLLPDTRVQRNEELSVWGTIAFEHVDKICYEVNASPRYCGDWGCCFNQVWYFGKQRSTRNFGSHVHAKRDNALNKVKDTLRQIMALEPREWPDLSLLNPRVKYMMAKYHSAPGSLIFVKDSQFRLSQRQPYFIKKQIWLSD